MLVPLTSLSLSLGGHGAGSGSVHGCYDPPGGAGGERDDGGSDGPDGGQGRGS